MKLPAESIQQSGEVVNSDAPVLCMVCGQPAIDAADYDFKGVDGCCEDAEWGYCRACDTWTERAADWSGV